MFWFELRFHWIYLLLLRYDKNLSSFFTKKRYRGTKIVKKSSIVSLVPIFYTIRVSPKGRARDIITQ